mmetsp:Transcript_115151/g.229348  ORF Transcript_115151/g.229348 Transcript_115151/m.229348 type:complete len:244 (+) Transcript_115151:2-733(+)
MHGPCRRAASTFLASGASTLEVASSRSQASASVIFGHGLGDTPQGWLWQCQAWARELPWVRFVLPAAPVRPVTLNGGLPMPAWYDIYGLDNRLQEPATGAEESGALWTGLLEAEARAVGSPGRVVLAGFSQGGAMALFTALHLNRLPQLAGVLCMSGYLPNTAALASGSVPQKKCEVPVLLCHGQLDGMVKLEMARNTQAALQGMGVDRVDLREYENMGHEVCEDELDDVAEWLAKALPDIAT